jgi:hypothetical protein
MTARPGRGRGADTRRHRRVTEDYFSRISGTVAVVGNGVLRCEFGSLIDAHDAVIRFNDFVIVGYERWCGRKVTHWCTFGETSTCPMRRRYRARLRPLSPFTEDAPESSGLLPRFRSRMAFASRDYRLPFFGRPSTGVMVLRILDSLGIAANVFGFDGFTTGHYYNPTFVHDPDHLATEFLYLASNPRFRVYLDQLRPCRPVNEDLPTLLERVSMGDAHRQARSRPARLFEN